MKRKEIRGRGKRRMQCEVQGKEKKGKKRKKRIAMRRKTGKRNKRGKKEEYCEGRNEEEK